MERTPNLNLIKPSPTDKVNIQDLNHNFEVLDNMFPIGYIYMSTIDTNPQTYFGGTWEKIEGKFLLGASAEYPVGSTGGEATHTLTVDEMPKHRHEMPTNNTYFEQTSMSGNAYVLQTATSKVYKWGTIAESGEAYLPQYFYQGGNQPHNNMPPYLAVYMWQRTA